MSEQPKVVDFPGQKPKQRQRSDDTIAKDIRAAYRRLCNLIDAATKVGLKVTCHLDSTDTYGGGLVRGREIDIIRKI